jgi:hypothetical protein
MVGVMVFKWRHKDKRLVVEADLSLPFDVPLSEMEMSLLKDDFTPSLAQAAESSKSILLA